MQAGWRDRHHLFMSRLALYGYNITNTRSSLEIIWIIAPSPFRYLATEYFAGNLLRHGEKLDENLSYS
jgi:hypothetical protein